MQRSGCAERQTSGAGTPTSERVWLAMLSGAIVVSSDES